MYTVALFARLEAKAGKENEGREVPGDRTCAGQSRSDNACMVRAAIGAHDLRRFSTRSPTKVDARLI